MSSPSIDLIIEFTNENAGLMVAYFFINILTLFFETIVISILLSKIFSAFDKKKDVKNLFIIFIAIFILIRLGYFLKSVVYDEIIPKFFYFLRTKLFNKVIDRYRVDYKELNIGYVLFNFEHLPSSFKRLMTGLLQEYIPNVLALLLCICFIFYRNKTIGAVVLLGVILFITVIAVTINNSISLSAVEHTAFEQDNEHIQDRVNNLFDIYTSGTEVAEKEEFDHLERYLERIMIDGYKYITMVISVLEVFVILVLVASFYLMYKNKTMSNENIISTILVLTYFFTYISKISTNYIAISDVFGYSKESDRFLREINASTIPTVNSTVSSLHGPVEFKNVNFKYPSTDSKKILNQANLYIKPGTKVAIFGKSGSGKSTLIKLLLGFYGPDSGSITINGKNIKDIGIDQLRKNISFVNQNPKLFDKTIFENMTYGVDDEITEDDIKKIIGNQNIFEGIGNGLNSNVGVSGSKLSGGQKQLVITVRAILKDTPIVILDEPTSALDQSTKTMVLNIIKNLKNKTVIIITHDFSILDCVDKVYELVNGKLKIK